MTDLTEREKQVVAWLRERALQHRMNKDCPQGKYFAEAYAYAAWVIERGEPFLIELPLYEELIEEKRTALGYGKPSEANERGEHLQGGGQP